MPQVCTVCRHPLLAAINQALVAGTALRNIAAQQGLSSTALFRHRNEHIPAALTQAASNEELRQALDVLQQLKAINGAALTVLRDARAAGEGDLALKAIDRIHRQIELQAKLLGELDDRPQIVLVQSPEWLTLRGRIVQALAPYREAAVALGEVLGDVG